VNVLDLVLLAAFAVAAVGGYRLGFLARVASWIGLALGLIVAARLLPALLDYFSGPDPAAKFFLAGGILIIGAFAGQALGLVVGHAVRRAVPMGPAASLDRAVGGVVGALGVLVMVWFLVPAMGDVPGSVSRLARSSAIARWVSDTLPRPPDTLQTLRRLVGDSDFPRVFDSLRPAPVTGPPPAQLGMPADVEARVSASTVRVQGAACRRIQEGSGFAVANDLVVTNAHVVAGERGTEVERPDGKILRAVVIMFDSDRDLAVLRVTGLDDLPLPIGSAKVGEEGAVFGHPNGQIPLRVAPAAVRQRVDARGTDLYDNHQTSRDVWILAADLHPGDSGSALTDTRGIVVGVAFAIAPDRPGTAYALTYKELQSALNEPRAAGGANTGPCLSHG
jgi:S1-C subfamily serine protease